MQGGGGAPESTKAGDISHQIRRPVMNGEWLPSDCSRNGGNRGLIYYLGSGTRVLRRRGVFLVNLLFSIKNKKRHFWVRPSHGERGCNL